MTVLLITLAVILLLVGTAGTIYPILPSLPAVFGGAWLLAHAQDYQIIGTSTLIIIGVLCAMGMACDSLASMVSAKKTGASKQALWGAFIGGIVGAFMGMIGIFIMPLVGAIVGEWIAKRNVMGASKVGVATFIGFVIGTVAKIGIALSVLLIILTQYYLS